MPKAQQQLASQEASRLHEKMDKWLQSGGDKILRDAIYEAEQSSDKVRAEYQVDPATLTDPVTL